MAAYAAIQKQPAVASRAAAYVLANTVWWQTGIVNQGVLAAQAGFEEFHYL